MQDLFDLVRFLLFSSGWTRFPTDRYGVWSETLRQLKEWGEDIAGLEVLKTISFYPHALGPIVRCFDGVIASLGALGMIATWGCQYEVMTIESFPAFPEDMTPAQELLLKKFKQILPKVCRASDHEAMHNLPA